MLTTDFIEVNKAALSAVISQTIVDTNGSWQNIPGASERIRKASIMWHRLDIVKDYVRDNQQEVLTDSQILDLAGVTDATFGGLVNDDALFPPLRNPYNLLRCLGPVAPSNYEPRCGTNYLQYFGMSEAPTEPAFTDGNTPFSVSYTHLRAHET